MQVPRCSIRLSVGLHFLSVIPRAFEPMSLLYESVLTPSTSLSVATDSAHYYTIYLLCPPTDSTFISSNSRRTTPHYNQSSRFPR